MNRIDKISKLLKAEYHRAVIALESQNPWQLLVATILSAQCTDARVNIVTKSLFKKYRTVDDFARADIGIFQQDIRSTGFYRNKAKNIISCAKKVIKDFGGKVPDNMDGLISLPGVARKTANVVLFSAFGKNEGIAVDTHVMRLSQRLGLSKNSNPEKIEKDLMKVLDSREWGSFSLRIILHGRKVCKAKNPQCLICVLNKLCPSKKTFYP